MAQRTAPFCRRRNETEAMKTYAIELQRVKAMSNAHGLITARIEALVQPQSPGRGGGGGGGGGDEGAEPLSMLSMTEETARVLMLLLKAQIAEFDKRKPRSRF